MRVNGIALQLSTDELARDKGLWWDADKHHNQVGREKGKIGFGIVFAIRWGRWYEPIYLGWKHNKWTSGKHWFVVNLPIIAPFLSIAIGKYGLYLGWKSFGLDWISYKVWAKEEDIKDGNTVMSLSASLRRNRTG